MNNNIKYYKLHNLNIFNIHMCEHCETFKHKISELTIQIFKQHSQIQSLQSKLSTETSSINNTSSEYPFPSEIKQTWEYISQFSLFDS